MIPIQKPSAMYALYGVHIIKYQSGSVPGYPLP